MADGTDIQMDNARNQTVSLGAPLPADSGRRPVKIFCHHCQQKLDVTSLEPFSRFRLPHVRDGADRPDLVRQLSA